MHKIGLAIGAAVIVALVCAGAAFAFADKGTSRGNDLSCGQIRLMYGESGGLSELRTLNAKMRKIDGLLLAPGYHGPAQTVSDTVALNAAYANFKAALATLRADVCPVNLTTPPPGF